MQSEEIIWGPTGVIEDPRPDNLIGPAGPRGNEEYLATLKTTMPADMTDQEFKNLVPMSNRTLYTVPELLTSDPSPWHPLPFLSSYLRTSMTSKYDAELMTRSSYQKYD